MATMFVALFALSTPVVAQSALALGLAATVGSGWQIEGIDVGLVRPVRAGPVRHWSVMARVGSFIDQGAFFAGQRGVIGAVALGARSGGLSIAELGDDVNVTRVALDLSVEVAGYLAANSPLPQGSSWLAGAVLPGIRVGEPSATQFTVLLGPAVFLGHASEVRAFLGVRAELPLASGGRDP